MHGGAYNWRRIAVRPTLSADSLNESGDQRAVSEGRGAIQLLPQLSWMPA